VRCNVLALSVVGMRQSVITTDEMERWIRHVKDPSSEPYPFRINKIESYE
jgi:hypothetical protein